MMHDTSKSGPGSPEPDPRVAAWLSTLDPGVGRRGYWADFHRGVVENARFELARRRALGATVADTVTSWARAVVPSALVAAAAAAVVLLGAPSTPEGVESELGVEELLSVGLEGEAIPVDFDESSAVGVTFAAAEIF